MTTPEEKKHLDQALKSIRIIWAALLASQVMYLFMGMIILKNSPVGIEPQAEPIVPPTFMDGFNHPLGPIWFGLAIVLIALSSFLPKKIGLGVLKPVGLRGEPLALTPFQLRLRQKTSQAIIGFAMIEAAALLGFMAMIVMRNQLFGTAIIAMAAAAFSTRFPTKIWIASEEEQ